MDGCRVVESCWLPCLDTAVGGRRYPGACCCLAPLLGAVGCRLTQYTSDRLRLAPPPVVPQPGSDWPHPPIILPSRSPVAWIKRRLYLLFLQRRRPPAGDVLSAAQSLSSRKGLHPLTRPPLLGDHPLCLPQNECAECLHSRDEFLRRMSFERCD